MNVKVTRYTHEFVGTCVILVDDNGELKELPRNHPLYISTRDMMRRAMASAMVETSPGVSSRRGPDGPIGNNRCEE